MTVSLPDDPALLALDEMQLRLEIACGLFAAGRISRGVGARVAGVDGMAFDEALIERHIPSHTSEILDQVTDTSVVLNLAWLLSRPAV